MPPKTGKKPYPVCGAKTRNAETVNAYCNLKAGHGTDHPGVGRCKFHGGKNQKLHGMTTRYDPLSRPRIRELIEHFKNDPDPMDLMPEVLLLRALLTDFIDRYDEIQEAAIRWNKAYGKQFFAAYTQWQKECRELIEEGADVSDMPTPPEPSEFEGTKKKALMDLSAVSPLVDRVGAMVDRVEQQRSKNHLTLETLDRVLEQIGVELVNTLREEVPDAATRSRILEKFEKRWERVNLDTGEEGPVKGNRKAQAN